MKKSFSILIFLALVVYGAKAQGGMHTAPSQVAPANPTSNLFTRWAGDSEIMHEGFGKRIIIQCNPLLEPLQAGGIVQISLGRGISWLLGGEYNNDNLNGGDYAYTIRTGLYFLTWKGVPEYINVKNKDGTQLLKYVTIEKRKYVCLQFFYRKWQPITDIVYDGDKGSYCSVISLFAGLFYIPDMYLYTANANVHTFGLDVTRWTQKPIGHSRHFVVEYFWGASVRIKEVQIEETGKVTGPWPPNTTVFKTFSKFALLPCIGINLGYRF